MDSVERRATRNQDGCEREREHLCRSTVFDELVDERAERLYDLHVVRVRREALREQFDAVERLGRVGRAAREHSGGGHLAAHSGAPLALHQREREILCIAHKLYSYSTLLLDECTVQVHVQYTVCTDTSKRYAPFSAAMAASTRSALRTSFALSVCSTSTCSTHQTRFASSTSATLVSARRASESRVVRLTDDLTHANGNCQREHERYPR